jgi:hypothetical protein
MIAASFGGDKACDFVLDGRAFSFSLQSATERIAAWDIYSEGETGYIKTDTLAWNTTHIHSSGGDEYGRQIYFFKYSFEIPEGAKILSLPDDENIIILAASVTENEAFAKTACHLFDRLSPRECTFILTEQEQRKSEVNNFRRNLYRMKFILNYAKRRLRKEISQL